MIRCNVYENPQLNPVLCELNTVLTLTSCFLRSTLILSYPLLLNMLRSLFALRSATKILYLIPSHACYMSDSSEIPWFDRPYSIFWQIQMMPAPATKYSQTPSLHILNSEVRASIYVHFPCETTPNSRPQVTFTTKYDANDEIISVFLQIFKHFQCYIFILIDCFELINVCEEI
jgi:hypothetical protein